MKKKIKMNHVSAIIFQFALRRQMVEYRFSGLT